MSDLDPSTLPPAEPRSAEAPPASPSSEDEAWAALQAAWDDEGAHKRYLSRFTDIEGLAVAGGRYKAVLDERPKDEVAVRMRAEVLKKAMVYGLAALPRPPAPTTPPWAKRLRLSTALSVGSLTVWLVYKLVVLLRGQP